MGREGKAASTPLTRKRKGGNSNAAKEGQSRGAQAARVMLILPQALQG